MGKNERASSKVNSFDFAHFFIGKEDEQNKSTFSSLILLENLQPLAVGLYIRNTSHLWSCKHNQAQHVRKHKRLGLAAYLFIATISLIATLGLVSRIGQICIIHLL